MARAGGDYGVNTFVSNQQRSAERLNIHRFTFKPVPCERQRSSQA
jgi:hypothetical protein